MSGLIHYIEDVITAFSRFAVSDDMPDYCDLRTVVRLTEADKHFRPDLTSPYIAVTEQGNYCSTFEAQGGFCEMDEDAKADQPFAFDGFISRVATAMTTDFRNPGHKISMVIENDPTQARAELKRLMAPQFRSVQRTGIAMQDILQEKIDRIAPWVSRERAWLTCWTSRATLSTHELRTENRRLAKMGAATPVARFGQNPALSELVGQKIRHDAFIDMVERAMNDSGNGLLMALTDVHQTGREIRRQVDRNGTAEEWYPTLPGDNFRPHGKRKGDDLSPFMAPWLNFQLMNVSPQSADNLIHINGMWHATLSVSLGPQQIQSYAQLKSRIPRGIPYRIRFDVMPGGMAALSWKKTLLDFSAFVPALRPIWESISALDKGNEHDPVCVMTIVASTWAKSRQDAVQNLTLLQKAFQGWGVCEVTTTFGNPYKAWASTLLAARTGGGPHNLYPPLSDALSMLPVSRPLSLWHDNASVIFPTPDGNLWPLGLASTLQNKHTEVVAGEPGSGKSQLLNMLSNAMVSTAQQKLPFIAVTDKGFSAQGQIQLIRDSLPPERKDEAIGIILRNHRDHCRNLFDTQLGARYPIEPELRWIKSILTVMCIDPGTGVPPNAKDIAILLERAVLLAYHDRAEGEVRKYDTGEAPDVDAVLASSGLWDKHPPEWWLECPWYEVRDLLFEAGHTQAAQQAQFMAVPELHDMQHYLGREEIRSAFATVTRDGSGELLLDYVMRCLSQACNDYKMLAGRTCFVISPETRIIAIDLNNVVGDKTPAGHLKTGIMYLFAGQISGGDFILPQYRQELLNAVLPMYHDIHLARLEQLDQEVKTKVYDELHNAKDIPFIFAELETQDREQRKFGIRTVLSSQYLTDFPSEILTSANSLYLMQCRQKDVPLLKEHFDVPEVTLRKFMRIPKGPAPDGSGTSFLGIFRTKPGRIAQILKNTMGPRELWALNSSLGDTSLRQKLYDELDGPTARDILADAFPKGSAAKIIEIRRKQAGERDDTNITAQLADELIRQRGYNL